MTKRIVGLLLALVMALSCMSFTVAMADATRTITVGVWWDIYYDSTHTALEDNPSYQGTLSDQMGFDAIRRVEQKYGVEVVYANMTYTGVSESINNSILAGTPDCDIYMCELQFGMPAVVNGYALDLHDVLPADSDIFNDQVVMTFLDLGDGHAYLFKPAAAEDQVANTYPLAFNKQMLEDANLEDPRELYARGEWTWEKFIEYCQALTKDTDGDGTIDVYGFGGCQAEWFYNLIMSNGTYVARGEVENWSSKEVGEVLQLMQDMYLTYNCAYPYPEVWDGSWDIMRYLYRDGKVAFTPLAAWICGTNADYDWDGTKGATLDFDMVMVPWPVGPSGNMETNRQKITGGAFYFLPVGVEDPELVYNVFYDLKNWYEGDITIRDDRETLDWWYGITAREPEIQDSNFEVMFNAGAREQYDNWSGIENDVIGGDNWQAFFRGEYTPAQFQETFRQQIQDAMDRINGK